MRRVTAIDRDRAVRKLSLLTGGITACSVALVGGFGLLAKHETDHKNDLKAQRSALAAAALSAKTTLVGATSTQPGTTRPVPTSDTATTSGKVLAFSAPTTSSATTSSTTTK